MPHFSLEAFSKAPGSTDRRISSLKVALWVYLTDTPILSVHSHQSLSVMNYTSVMNDEEKISCPVIGHSVNSLQIPPSL